jgi:aldehyde:ferredoxin oxidoreductase
MSKEKLTVLSEFEYEIPGIEHGYTNQTLYVNVGSGEIKGRAVTEDMKEKFIGGRGFDLWLLWNGVNDDTKWDDPENEITIASGPCGGITQYPGSGKSIASSISPLTEIVIDSNAGGHYGPYLKFAGWDAIEVQGKAERDVFVYVDGPAGTVSVIEAPEETPTNTHELGHWITEHFAESEKDKRFFSFVSAGLGSEHSRMGCLNFSLWDRKRKDLRYKQAGRGGIGTVLRDKKIKALIVRTPPFKGDTNEPDDLELIVEVGANMQREVATYDDKQNKMRKSGTSYLVEIMNDYDLLPVHNFKFGRHPEAHRIKREVWEEYYTQGLPDGCWYGCTVACAHAVDGYQVRTGPYKGDTVIVDGPEYETIAGCGSNCGIFEPWYLLEVNFYCDTYGIDTISFGTGMAFVMECYEAGILDKEKTGGLDLHFGNAEAALEVLHQMALGEGFGLIFGQGVRRMKDYFVEHFGADRQFVEDIGMENKGLEYSEYMTKESIAQQGGYGLTNKGPQHDEAWLIFMDMVNNELPTFEDKAEALHYFPMWRTWFGLCGFCKLPWNDVVDPKNAHADEPQKIPHHVENYVKIFEGVTGKEVTADDLIDQSERVYNLQRVFNLRLGKGLREHDAIPYRSAGPVTEEEYLSRQERYDTQLREWLDLDPEEMTLEEKMAAHREYRTQQYEHLIDAVYERRGWTEKGVPTPEKLKALGIDYPDVMTVVERYL